MYISPVKKVHDRRKSDFDLFCYEREFYWLQETFPHILIFNESIKSDACGEYKDIRVYAGGKHLHIKVFLNQKAKP